MSKRDYVWECDYGEYSRCIQTISELLDTQNADELGMCTLFANNNPYNLELYVVFTYDNPKPNQIELMLHRMSSVGARQRPDIIFSELTNEMIKGRFNSHAACDSRDLMIGISTLFRFKERFEISKSIPMSPLGNRKPVFLSHSSINKPFVEDIIPYLTHKGLPVWFDKISIDYGEGILSAVQSGIKDSGAVIFVVTQSFLSSSWCKFEMENFLTRFASGGEVLILTIVANDVDHQDLPLFLQSIKYLKLTTELNPKDVANELLPSLIKYFNTAPQYEFS